MAHEGVRCRLGEKGRPKVREGIDLTYREEEGKCGDKLSGK